MSPVPQSPLLGRRVTSTATSTSSSPKLSANRARASSDPVFHTLGSYFQTSPTLTKNLLSFAASTKPESGTSVAQYQAQWNLHQACAAGNIGLVKLALDHGASLNVLYNGMHPIHVAAAYGDIPILNLIYSFALQTQTIESVLNARRLSRAASTSLDNLVNYNLISSSSALMVKMNVDLLGASPLHFAVANRQLEAVIWLCQKGARCMLADEYQSTPLDLAIATQQHDMVHVLVAAIQEQQPDALNRYISTTHSPSSTSPCATSPLASPIASSPNTSHLSSSPDHSILQRSFTVSNDHRMAGMVSHKTLPQSPTRSMTVKSKSSSFGSTVHAWVRGRTLSDRSQPPSNYHSPPWSSRSKSNEKGDKLEEWDFLLNPGSFV